MSARPPTSTRRVVEQQQKHILFFEASSEEHLLLVAAAKRFRRRAEALAVEPDQPGETLSERGGNASTQNAATAHRLQASREKVARDGLVKKQPFAFAIVGSEHRAGPDRPLRDAETHGAAGNRYMAARVRSEPCERPQDLARARPHLARDGDDLAAVRAQSEIDDMPGHREPVDDDKAFADHAAALFSMTLPSMSSTMLSRSISAAGRDVSNQGVNLALTQREQHVVERHNRPERLGGATHLQRQGSIGH
jgi:hypothetical protein